MMMMEEEAELCFPHLNSSCRKTKRPHSHTVLIYILLSCISLLTVTLNLLVVVSISHFRQLHTSTNFLLLSLAVSDFLVGLVILFESMFIDGCWLLGDLVCAVYCVFEYIVTSSSVGTMVLISIDRYVAICYPLLYPTRVTLKRVRIFISLCWICCLLFAGVQVRETLKQPNGYKTCVGECVLVVTTLNWVVDLILVFIIPISALLVLYLRVFVVAVAQARAVRSHTAVASHQRSGRVSAKKSELKAARTLGVVIVVFISCICPFYCVTLAGQDASVALCLFYLNSCLNPVIYAFFYPWFRKAIRLIATLEIMKPGSSEINMLK